MTDPTPKPRWSKGILGRHPRFGRVTSTRSRKRGPPTNLSSRTFRGKPKNFLELIAWVIDDPARSRRAGALIVVIGACLGGIVFVIQLRPERWAYVTGAAVSVIAIAKAIRGGKNDTLRRDLAVMGDVKENPDSDHSK